MDKNIFLSVRIQSYLFCIRFLSIESAPCPALSGDVPFIQWEILSVFKNFHQTKQTDTSIWCTVIAWLKCSKNWSRESQASGDEFCYQITKFCMFYLFPLCNKSVSWSGQAFNHSFYTGLKCLTFAVLNGSFHCTSSINSKSGLGWACENIFLILITLRPPTLKECMTCKQ